MRYIKFSGSNGYYDWDECYIMKDDTPDKALNEMAYVLAMDYADSYDYLAEGYDVDMGWLSVIEEEDYYDGITYDWREISKEEYLQN